MNYEPWHEAYDQEKLQAMIAILEKQVAESNYTWPFSPLVAVGDYWLITGSHRYAAVQKTGWDADGFPVEVIDLRDIFAEAGLDFDKRYAAHGSPGIYDDEFLHCVWELPPSVRAKYGIDIDDT